MECKQEVQYIHFEIADFGQYQKGTKRLSKQKWCNIEQKWCDFTKKRRDLEQMWFRTKNSAICEQITLLRANQIAGITSDFKMDIINEFIWNQIKNFMSPLAISSMHGFWGLGGIDCGFKGLEALVCELWIILQWFTIAWESQDEKWNYFWVIITSSYHKATRSKFT